jgi:hypothetical protein
MDARRAALEHLIDHAALFPPASMSMADALAEDARVRAEETGWIVGRFVVPASRLGELDGYDGALSVVLDADLSPVDRRIEAVEVPPTASGDTVSRANAAGRARSGEASDTVSLETYVEGTPGDMSWLDELGGRRAKVRCGGATTPSADELAAFIRRCRELGVVFKATAGLHHPVRHGEEHGFLNLLGACVFGFEEAVLADDDPSAFKLTPDRFSWRGQGRDADGVARVRRELFASFGSCSVQEPVDGLRELGIL